MTRRRGPFLRGLCPGCLQEKRVKADGTMGAHGRITSQGYTAQRTCSGVDKEPIAKEGT